MKLKNGCSVTCYEKTERLFKVRMCEHLGDSALTGKKLKGNNSDIKKHHLFCNHSSRFNNMILKLPWWRVF